jgi:TPR repeat protein
MSLCENDDISILNLAQSYLHGIGVEKDIEKAIFLLLKIYSRIEPDKKELFLRSFGISLDRFRT